MKKHVPSDVEYLRDIPVKEFNGIQYSYVGWDVSADKAKQMAKMETLPDSKTKIVKVDGIYEVWIASEWQLMQAKRKD